MKKHLITFLYELFAVSFVFFFIYLAIDLAFPGLISDLFNLFIVPVISALSLIGYFALKAKQT